LSHFRCSTPKSGGSPTIPRYILIISVHLWRRFHRSCLSCIQSVGGLVFFDVNGHKKTAPQTHTLHREDAVAEHGGNGGVDGAAILFENGPEREFVKSKQIQRRITKNIRK
jgi:hypothetical protein